MKKIIFAVAVVAMFASCGTKEQKVPVQSVTFIEGGMAFPESVIFNGQDLLAVNFGSAELNPLNAEGKGYVVSLSDSANNVFIAADGNMSAPKGTVIKNGKLYIADVGKVLVYSLDSLTAAPDVVALPDLYANDLGFCGDSLLYITETSTGAIYKFDLADSMKYIVPATYIPGANGILFNGSTAYVASYPADGKVTADNVIYVVEDMAVPSYSKVIERPGMYDGLAFSDDKSKLYFTDWSNGGQVGYVDLATKEVFLLDLGGAKIEGPGRMVIKDGVLYVPDLKNSRIAKIKL